MSAILEVCFDPSSYFLALVILFIPLYYCCLLVEEWGKKQGWGLRVASFTGLHGFIFIISKNPPFF